MKLNVDGCMYNSILGAGGCIRDEYGCWYDGFTKFIGIGSAIQAELWVLFLGLKPASSHNITNLRSGI